MYKNVDIFDFDGTLFYTPDFYEGKEIWEKKKGIVWPYNGWASKPESLDLEVFYIPLNMYVYNKYLKSISDSETLTVLATGRLVRLRAEIDKILDFHGLKFDQIELNPNSNTFRFKTRLFTNLINEHKPEVFTIYDDHHSNLVEWENKWAPTMGTQINIIDVTKSDKTPIVVNNK